MRLTVDPDASLHQEIENMQHQLDHLLLGVLECRSHELYYIEVWEYSRELPEWLSFMRRA
jgi:hypothetical protein